MFIRWKYLINCGNPAALGSDQVVPSLFFLLIRVVHVDKSVDDLEGVLGKQGFFLYIGCWHPTRAHPHFPSNPAALRSPLYIFALTPISSAQLFEAAGLARAKLRPLLLAFTIGRGISYAGYTFGTGALKNVGITKTILEGVTSPWAIGVQILLIGSLVPLSRINWHRFLKKEQSA